MLIVAYCSNSFAQQTKPIDENNLYYKALISYLEKRAEMYESNEYLKTQEYLNVLIEENSELTDGLPEKSGRFTMKYLDYTERAKTFKTLGKEYRLVIVHPIQFKDGKLVIGFSEHMFSFKKKVSFYAVSDGCRVEFRYDCEKKVFVVDKVELWGI